MIKVPCPKLDLQNLVEVVFSVAVILGVRECVGRKIVIEAIQINL